MLPEFFSRSLSRFLRGLSALAKWNVGLHGTRQIDIVEQPRIGEACTFVNEISTRRHRDWTSRSVGVTLALGINRKWADQLSSE
ncbi:hypothetical protein B5P45_07390 [Phyllobacterium zundukense]|uniref:Uncharacterized protein n=1 Tax=Phyllobacterium zundukense TaxID=1867719 RepID=A0A2N9W184_9HYPH|nr:hypothetical protein BLM14_22725 [Phyllobacterium zundukense]PIO45502.1 hypothetical protein B5P45_07390 [Phyllobacterium zundukense]